MLLSLLFCLLHTAIKVILLQLKLDHISILQSQDPPTSSHFSQSKIKWFIRPYIILSYLTITLILLVTLLAVPQTNQAHFIPLSLRTSFFLWLKCFSLIHLHGCLLTSFRSHSKVLRGVFSNHPTWCIHFSLYPSYFTFS